MWLQYDAQSGEQVGPMTTSQPPVGRNRVSVAVPASAMANPPLTIWSPALRGFVETPEGIECSAAPSPWMTRALENDFSSSTTAARIISGLGFVPKAHKRYEIEAKLLLQTTATTTGARPGVSWPAALADGAVEIVAPAPMSANQSYLGRIDAVLVAGPTPSGSFQLTLASEIASSVVRAKAGSFLRYREF